MLAKTCSWRGEGLLAEPHRALAAHVRDGRGLHRVHEHRHRMAADAGERAAAFGHPGRAVVRAAGAEAGAAERRGPVAEPLRRARPARSSRKFGSCRRSALTRTSATSSGVVFAEIGNGGRAAGRIERRAVEKLADDARRVRRRHRGSSRIWSSSSGRFSSTTTMRSSPSANSRTTTGSSGHTMPTLRSRRAGRRAVVGEARDCRAPAAGPATPCRPRPRRSGRLAGAETIRLRPLARA